ncbi:MAG: 50S ribosomal protein L6 [Chloroflexota bacterium]|nr:50S ribosomal protein L6 [Chloroflexota bacterium]
MSRIGRLPVALPQGVKVSIKGNDVTVTGPKGELQRQFHPDMSITQNENTLVVSRPSDSKLHRSLHGLTRTLLANMVEGVTKGFQRELEIVGVGYRATKAGNNVTVNVGYSNPVEVIPLPGISLDVEGTHIKVSGANKETVGQMSAQIRKIRPPDAYKGKGIRYAGEVVHLKPGKAGKAIGQTK